MNPEPPHSIIPSVGTESLPRDGEGQKGLLIHPLSSILLIAIDNLWTLGEWMALAWAITVPLSFLAVLFPAFLIQRFLGGDSFGRAATIGSVLAVLAAVPTPITGTTAGALALGWSGVRLLTARRGD